MNCASPCRMNIKLSWSILRNVGASRLVRSTMFIPLLGYMIVFNDSLLPYLKLTPDVLPSSSHTGSAAGNVSDALNRLRFIYLGLCSLAAGSFLYHWLCPIEIANSHSKNEFVELERELSTPVSVETMRKKLSKLDVGIIQIHDMDEVLRTDTSEFIGGLLGANTKLAWLEWSNRNRSMITSLLTMQYDVANESLSFGRYFVSALFALGFALLLKPSVSIFLEILNSVASK
jgi:hypothetical protein